MRVTTIIVFLSLTLQAGAHHLLGGEIRYRSISNLTYEISLRLWSSAPVSTLPSVTPLQFGDGQVDSVHTTNFTTVQLDSSLYENTYSVQHTYSGSGIYQAYIELFNLVAVLQNYPTSASKPMRLAANIYCFPTIGTSESPSFANDRLVDTAIVGQAYTFCPYAADPDGDAIEMSLLSDSANGYTLPSGSFTMDLYQHVLSWNMPTLQGRYLYTVLVRELRQSGNSYVVVGETTRQLEIIAVPAGTVGIASAETPAATAFYPNPIVRGNLLTIPAANPRYTHMVLADATGRTIQVAPAGTGSTQLDTSPLAPGLYLLRLTNSKESTLPEKLVVTGN